MTINRDYCINYEMPPTDLTDQLDDFTPSKLPLITWFVAIYLITHALEGISALSPHLSLIISINASLQIKHKLHHVLKQADHRVKLEGLIKLYDFQWGGKRSDG